jgi:hypothetical protein
MSFAENDRNSAAGPARRTPQKMAAGFAIGARANV